MLILLSACADTPATENADAGQLQGRFPLTAMIEQGGNVSLANTYKKMQQLRGEDYRPRTRHLDDQGKAIYTNRLFFESSPYLLQHAHNPVNWYPWGDEAFETARKLDRPVLLSVGYSTCHWCHVMEEESFEDVAIAGYLNDNYIAVKVDREERPDVDAIYMSAVQALAGRGGWPMTVWLTPDRKPFYGGTYYPARDGDRGAAVGFLTLLKKIRAGYTDKRELVDRSADELARAIRQMLTPAAGERLPVDGLQERAVASSRTRFDSLNGGIAGAPKFPSSLPIRLLMRHHRRTGTADSLHMAILTLDKMAAGGMHDQVGGGFHRYSTDARWLVPHFEKMLYDNALLVPAYIEGWQVTGNRRLRQVAIRTLDYVAREMTSPEGAFFSATDADSRTPSGHREEGYYFTWTLQELEEVLPADDARLAASAYGMTATGNFEGRNVLFLPRDFEALAEEQGVSADQLAADMDRINGQLYAHRRKRPAPLRDEKILAAWNGLMISAFARAGFALAKGSYIQRADRAAAFVWDQMVVDGRLRRSYQEGAARGNGFLDDYAYTIAALLDLFAATADAMWLDRAVQLDRILQDQFADSENGGFFMTAHDHEELIAREKPVLDGALPSGNAIAMMNLLRLHAVTLQPGYLERAEKGLRAFSATMEANPTAFGEMLLAVDDYLHPPRQVIVVGPDEPAADGLARPLRAAFLPGSLVMAVSERQADRLSRATDLFNGKTAIDGQATAYVCRQGACRLPTTREDEMMNQINSRDL